MSQSDMEIYSKYFKNVQREIRELRVILESLEAKNRERTWLRNQTTGDVDDSRLYIYFLILYLLKYRTQFFKL